MQAGCPLKHTKLKRQLCHERGAATKTANKARRPQARAFSAQFMHAGSADQALASLLLIYPASSYPTCLQRGRDNGAQRELKLDLTKASDRQQPVLSYLSATEGFC